MPGVKRINIAETKLKILDIMVANPGIERNRIKSILWHQYHIFIDYRTVQKYMNEMEIMLNRIRLEIEKKIEDKIENGDDLWQKITKMLK